MARLTPLTIGGPRTSKSMKSAKHCILRPTSSSQAAASAAAQRAFARGSASRLRVSVSTQSFSRSKRKMEEKWREEVGGSLTVAKRFASECMGSKYDEGTVGTSEQKSAAHTDSRQFKRRKRKHVRPCPGSGLAVVASWPGSRHEHIEVLLAR